MAKANPRALPLTLRLRHRGHETALGPGSYVIGRHSTCDVVVESALVSRRHARLEITDDYVSILDLKSANGVWVNGDKIGPDPTRLHGGDRLMIGDEEIEIGIDAPVRSGSGELARISAPRPSWFNDDDDGDEPLSSSERSQPGTRQADFFELVGKIVDRVIAEKRYDDAATMLQAQMGKVLADARGGRFVPIGARDATLRYAAELARGTGSTRWLEYALDVLTALSTAPMGALAQELFTAFSLTDPVDPARFAAYLAAAERIEAPLERIRVTQWAREIERASSRRSR